MTNDRRYDFICGIHNDQHDGVVRILEAAYMKSVVMFCSCDAECALLDIAGEISSQMYESEANPTELEALADRLYVIKSLCNKYKLCKATRTSALIFELPKFSHH